MSKMSIFLHRLWGKYQIAKSSRTFGVRLLFMFDY